MSIHENCHCEVAERRPWRSLTITIKKNIMCSYPVIPSEAKRESRIRFNNIAEGVSELFVKLRF